MGWAPLPEDAQLDNFVPLPDDAQLDAPAAEDAPEGSGFTDEQKRQILDYLPHAKDAADLERFSLELSGGRSKIGNAQDVLDKVKGGAGRGDFGFARPTIDKSLGKAPESTSEHLRNAIGDSILNTIEKLAPGAGTFLRVSRDSGSGKAYTEHAANALAFDYGPEVGGLIQTVLNGGDLDNNVLHERARLTGDSEDHGVASALGELSGVAAMAPVTGAIGGAANLGRVGRGVQMVGEGAAFGSGAAGPDNRLEGAVEGAILAPIASLAVRGIGAAASGVKSLVTGGGSSVLGGSPSLARRIIAKAIKEDANTPDSVGQMISDAQNNGVPMALGDTGENVRGLLAASSRASGMGRTIVRDALEERQSNLADRIVGHIERDLGPIANPHQVADDLMTTARDEAAPIYEKFYSDAPVSSPAIDAFVQRPSMQKALKNAYRIAQEEGRDPEALGLRLGEDGKVTLERGPTLTADEAKKASPNRFKVADIPDEMNELRVRNVQTSTGRRIKFRGPIDITQRLRMMGGVQDYGGDLAHIGIDNKPRRMDFGSNEQFLGRLINPEGMSLDDAALQLWHDGYFPESLERPTVNDLIDKLADEHKGIARYFDPQDAEEVSNYHFARTARHTMEDKANEGSPFAEDTTRHAGSYEDLVNRAGPPVAGRQPLAVNTYTPQTLDYIKRGMDDVVETYKDPTTGRYNFDTEGRAVNNTLRSYMKVVDQLYPDYAKAREAYGGPVSGINAMNLGRKALRANADDIEAQMRNMTPFEKSMYALGIRRAMAQLVSSKDDTADIVHALVGTGKKRAMLARAFGDRQQFKRFVDTLSQEREGWRSFRQALLGSPTAANVQDDAMLQTAAVATDFMLGGQIPVATATSKAIKFLGFKLSKKAQEQVAALLSDTDPASLRELAAQLRAQAERKGLAIPPATVVSRGVGNLAAAQAQ